MSFGPISSKGQLEVRRMGRDFTWFDMGTHDSLLEASAFVKSVRASGSRVPRKLPTSKVSSHMTSS
jgi:dTDP-glucose pyrophosphorylase